MISPPKAAAPAPAPHRPQPGALAEATEAASSQHINARRALAENIEALRRARAL